MNISHCFVFISFRVQKCLHSFSTLFLTVLHSYENFSCPMLAFRAGTSIWNVRWCSWEIFNWPIWAGSRFIATPKTDMVKRYSQYMSAILWDRLDNEMRIHCTILNDQLRKCPLNFIHFNLLLLTRQFFQFIVFNCIMHL